MLRIVPACDMITNGVPHPYDLPVNRACMEVGVSGLDISSEDPQFPAQPFFEELAKRGIQIEEEIEERGFLAS